MSCITCFNPHLLLKAINIYRKSKKLESHSSLTTYIEELKSGKKFDEITDEKLCKSYVFQTVTESYIGKAGKPVEYTRTARVDQWKPVSELVKRIIEESDKYLKHRTYVDNCNRVFPLMRDAYQGKYIELDFSQNLALRPKHEVQSAHFSGKQFTLHCVIVEPFDIRYHYHLSNDLKHDGILSIRY